MEKTRRLVDSIESDFFESKFLGVWGRNVRSRTQSAGSGTDRWGRFFLIHVKWTKKNRPRRILIDGFGFWRTIFGGL